MATLTQTPPEWAFVQESIYAVLSTDKQDTARATIDFVISGAPAVGQTIQLAWTGGGVTFTAAAALSANGLSWPAPASGLLVDYVALVLEFLRQYEPITDIFDVELLAGGPPYTIRLSRKIGEIFHVQIVNENLANITATATPVTEITTPDNLSGLITVHTPDHAQVMKLHGTYNTEGECPINLSPAFTMLDVVLPPTNSIASTAWQTGVAATHVQPYYIRYADKYGNPPVAEALVKSEGPYYAVMGGRSRTDTNIEPGQRLRHSYRTADGAQLRKPVNPEQPDWLYWLPIESSLDGPTYYVTVQVEWSDGTQSVHHPYGTIPRAYVSNQINWIKCGYRQLLLHNLAVPSGTEPGSFITGYTVELMQPSGTTGVTAAFEVEQLATPGTTFLLMENGVGGLETVWLRGAATRMYSATKEQWRKARHYGNQSDIADIDILFSEGRERVKVSTGLYETTEYLDHLKQIVHGKCWIVDTINNRFLPVIVESSELESIIENETLHQFNVELLSAWINHNYTL